MTIDENVLRSRHTRLNSAIVARELRADFAPTIIRFGAVLAVLAALAVALGGV